ncbi:hypothetical protein LAB1_49030 [Roseibium sp. LAB1]
MFTVHEFSGLNTRNPEKPGMRDPGWIHDLDAGLRSGYPRAPHHHDMSDMAAIAKHAEKQRPMLLQPACAELGVEILKGFFYRCQAKTVLPLGLAQGDPKSAAEWVG